MLISKEINGQFINQNKTDAIWPFPEKKTDKYRVQIYQKSKSSAQVRLSTHGDQKSRRVDDAIFPFVNKRCHLDET